MAHCPVGVLPGARGRDLRIEKKEKRQEPAYLKMIPLFIDAFYDLNIPGRSQSQFIIDHYFHWKCLPEQAEKLTFHF
jgi:hypothetical protein